MFYPLLAINSLVEKITYPWQGMFFSSPASPLVNRPRSFLAPISGNSLPLHIVEQVMSYLSEKEVCTLTSLDKQSFTTRAINSRTQHLHLNSQNLQEFFACLSENETLPQNQWNSIFKRLENVKSLKLTLSENKVLTRSECQELIKSLKNITNLSIEILDKKSEEVLRIFLREAELLGLPLKGLHLTNKAAQQVVLPYHVWEWTELESLTLNNFMTDSISIIGTLIKLKKLILVNMKMDGLSSEIGKLTNLRKLQLSYLREAHPNLDIELRRFPAEIGKLHNLEKLVIESISKKAILPIEIAELKKLKVFDAPEALAAAINKIKEKRNLLLFS